MDGHRDWFRPFVPAKEHDVNAPAVDFADFLVGLVKHLRAHPHLPRAHVFSGQQDGELQLSDGDEAEHLHIWFSSLDEAEVLARPWFTDRRHAYVLVRGVTKSGHGLRVWNMVPDLGVALGYGENSDDELSPIDDSVLVDFALASVQEVAA